MKSSTGSRFDQNTQFGIRDYTASGEAELPKIWATDAEKKMIFGIPFGYKPWRILLALFLA